MARRIYPLAIAEFIIVNDRIDDLDDWEKMKLELEYEMDSMGIEDRVTRTKILTSVKEYMY